MRFEPVFAIPPVQHSGKLSTAIRVNDASNATDTISNTNTWEHVAASYIWQPWFGLWRARGRVSRVDIDAEQDSTVNLLTGNLDINLFHRSHFPLTAFASLQDNRVEIDGLQDADNDVRSTSFGLTQQFQDTKNGAFYLGTLLRDNQTNYSDDTETTVERLLTSADKRGEIHSIAGVFTLDRTRSSIADSELVIGQLTFNHSYRPYERLSVDTGGFLTLTETDSLLDTTESESFSLTSNVSWQSANLPLRLRGEAGFSQDETQSDLSGTTTRDRIRLRAGGRYEFSPQFSFIADAGLDRNETQVTRSTRTFQTASLIYNSLPIPWRSYSYAWNARGVISNSTETDAPGEQTYSAGAGHNLSRGWTADYGVPINLVVDAGQDISVSSSTRESELTQINHRASLSANYTGERSSTYGQVSAFSLISYGRDDTSLFTFNLLGSHSRTLSRYRNFALSFTYNFSGVSNEGISNNNDFFSIEARFRDARLFNVRQLAFESRLTGDANGLFASDDEIESRELEWDNRISYRIGRLEVEGRIAYTLRDDNNNTLYLLTISRRY